MRLVLGEDVCHTYRIPAPWGSLILTEALDSLWQIDVGLGRIDAPDVMPASIRSWADALEALLTDASVPTPEFYETLFALPRMQDLSPFSQTVLRKVADIEPGHFQTYGEIAMASGKPHAYRAVGQILASNPFLILIPCHRVAGAGALANLNLSEPKTFEPPSYRGQVEFAPIGAWLRLHDIACASEN